jgi:hypothetical protein
MATACALCGLEVGKQPLTLATRQGSLEFCCEGCVGIYQMLHPEELADSTAKPPETTDKQGE